MKTNVVDVGDPAPGFDALDQHGQRARLTDLRGRWVVLYFYPKDETRGCTAQACAFRDRLSELSTLDAQVFGVSTDSVESHRDFARRHALPFGLLADPSGDLCRAYDALGLLGYAKRVTFVVDPEGVVRGVHRSEIDPAGHVEWARRTVDELRLRLA
ncbi:MAG TPA: peroxiredoxin [Burkholderiales bacterium]|nr:peroxiredoxin [Burkholderiales bacterium]